MRLRQSRSGFTLIEIILALAVLALAVVTFILWGKVNAVDDRGKALTAWARDTDADGTAHNMPAPAGLTTYLIALSQKLATHMGQKAAPNGPAHTGVSDSHLDPPPPPDW